MELLLLATEMEVTPLEMLTPMDLPSASGFGAAFVVVRLLFGLLLVVVPLGVLIYGVVLLRRLTAAVEGIERRLVPRADDRELDKP